MRGVGRPYALAGTRCPRASPWLSDLVATPSELAVARWTELDAGIEPKKADSTPAALNALAGGDDSTPAIAASRPHAGYDALGPGTRGVRRPPTHGLVTRYAAIRPAASSRGTPTSDLPQWPAASSQVTTPSNPRPRIGPTRLANLVLGCPQNLRAPPASLASDTLRPLVPQTPPRLRLQLYASNCTHPHTLK